MTRQDAMAHRYHGRLVYVVMDASGKQHAALAIRCKGRLIEIVAEDEEGRMVRVSGSAIGDPVLEVC